MKCESLLSGIKNKSIKNLSSAEFAQRVVMVKWYEYSCRLGEQGGGNSVRIDFTPSEKGSILKEKKMLPHGTNSFL